MKILLREHNGKPYEWVSAKYNRGHFTVDGHEENWSNVVSVVNDNRKHYSQCSCCGHVFRKGDPRFAEHKANAVKPNTCFDCPTLSVDDEWPIKSQYFVRPDGTIGEKIERDVTLKCSKGSSWYYPNICSKEVIEACRKRQCADATEIEISDFFTEYPGVFDDIITVDRLLDDGHNVVLREGGRETCFEFVSTDDYTIGAVINGIGIIDRFFVWWAGDKYTVYYSRKYDELVTTSRGEYCKWVKLYMTEETRNEIKNEIKKLYN